MQALSLSQVTVWCAARGVQMSTAGYPHYGGVDFRCIEIRIPKEAGKLLAFGYSLLMTGVPEDEEKNFQGGVLWIKDSDLLSETFDRVGHQLLNALRSTALYEVKAVHTPALSFAAGEIVEAQASIIIPMVFQWDAVMVPASGDHVVFISHDEVIQITTRTAALFEDIFARLEEGNWNLKERKVPDYLAGC